MSAVLEPQAAEVSGPVTEKPAELAIASLNDTVLAHYKAIEPVATDKRALLFTTLQVVELRTALVAHLMSLEIEYPA